jgi:Coenzyme PQQ synthesis protein D (PqqD)
MTFDSDLPPRLRLNSRVSAERTGYGAVLIDADTGECYELNQTGIEVWNHIQQRGTISDLAGSLAAKYKVDEQQIASDIERLLHSMLDHGLVTSESE